MVREGDCQFGIFSHKSLLHHCERLETGYCKEIRLNEGMRLVLVEKKRRIEIPFQQINNDIYAISSLTQLLFLTFILSFELSVSVWY